MCPSYPVLHDFVTLTTKRVLTASATCITCRHRTRLTCNRKI